MIKLRSCRHLSSWCLEHRTLTSLLRQGPSWKTGGTSHASMAVCCDQILGSTLQSLCLKIESDLVRSPERLCFGEDLDVCYWPPAVKCDITPCVSWSPLCDVFDLLISFSPLAFSSLCPEICWCALLIWASALGTVLQCEGFDPSRRSFSSVCSLISKGHSLWNTSTQQPMIESVGRDRYLVDSVASQISLTCQQTYFITSSGRVRANAYVFVHSVSLASCFLT